MSFEEKVRQELLNLRKKIEELENSNKALEARIVSLEAAHAESEDEDEDWP